ncbi:hypothetical protein B0H66DRAFT_568963 [Apodospora peruviana]|uniref:Uncharacterized protein n=1 Tax=Apodospora peruviana TaxID=516989 RepID=A0AAE0LYX2_9PEZI|nr:hypothetical protein B0H66DRAFT_568963 [Apodospora peruviana]
MSETDATKSSPPPPEYIWVVNFPVHIKPSKPFKLSGAAAFKAGYIKAGYTKAKAGGRVDMSPEKYIAMTHIEMMTDERLSKIWEWCEHHSCKRPNCDHSECDLGSEEDASRDEDAEMSKWDEEFFAAIQTPYQSELYYAADWLKIEDLREMIMKRFRRHSVLPSREHPHCTSVVSSNSNRICPISLETYRKYEGRWDTYELMTAPLSPL